MKAAASAGRRKSAYPGRSEPGAEPAMILFDSNVNKSQYNSIYFKAELKINLVTVSLQSFM